MNKIFSNYFKPVFLGVVCALAFAPIFFTLGIFTLSVLCRYIKTANNIKAVFRYAYLFGFGFFFTTLYWIAIALKVYIDMFGWLIPFALFVPSLIMAIIIGIIATFSWLFKDKYYYHFIFCVVWVFCEWCVSWLFTGFPWSLLGYSLSFSTILIQSASLFSVFGLSFIAVYVGSCLYGIRKYNHHSHSTLADSAHHQRQMHQYIPIIISFIMLIFMISFGLYRLNKNPTQFTDIKIRIVQPSIPQKSKWDAVDFWNNLDHQVLLSKQMGDPDIIIWSEAALTAPYHYPSVLSTLKTIFTKENQILISGGVIDNDMDNNIDNDKEGDDYEIYSALIAMNSQSDNNDNLLFTYHKAHLVPFGEYIPFKNILPLKKITHGLQDYTKGKSNNIVDLKPYNLKIRPLICYESIFPLEVVTSNQHADLFINVTNDSWYGNSSGPYQHFEISRMRAIENGIPLIRAGNNGISAIIDPLGRTITTLHLDAVGVLDSLLPTALDKPTLFSDFYLIICILFITIVCLIQLILMYFFKIYF